MTKRARGGEVLMGRLQRGDDLLGGLAEQAKAAGVRAGRLQALGAVEKARVGFYDQGAFEYRFLDLGEPLEILALIGNVSLRDGEPMVHAHVTLGDARGKAFGGHLVPGTTVFACEFTIAILEGQALHRAHDDATGLPLWKP